MIREYTENKEEFKLMQLLQDIDDRKTSEVRLKNAAQTDPLTKLYNKTTTQKMIDKYLEGEGAGGSHAFIIIDLDEFKSINDTHGHFAGDDVLIQLSKELRSYFRESDILGRIGGDEFVAFIKNVQSVALVCDKVQRLSASFKNMVLIIITTINYPSVWELQCIIKMAKHMTSFIKMQTKHFMRQSEMEKTSINFALKMLVR